MPVIVRKTCQIGGFLLLASMLFCILSVSSYTPADPTWDMYSSHPTAVKNLGGVVGASLAKRLWEWFGGMIFLPIGMGGILAWHLMWGRLAVARNVLWRGSVLLCAGGTATALLFGHRRILWGKFFAGGMTSDWCAEIMVTYLNKTGSYLVLATVVCLMFFIGREQLVLRKAAEGFTLLGYAVLDSRQRVRRWGGRVRGLLIRWYNVPRQLCRAGYMWLQERLYRAPWYTEYDAHDLADAETQTMLAPATAQAAYGQDRGAAPAVVEFPRRQERVATPAVVQAPQRQETTVVPPLVLPRHVSHAAPRQQETRSETVAVSAPPVSKVSPERLTGEEIPSIELLEPVAPLRQGHASEDLDAQARFLEQKLREFGVEGEVVQVLPGPVITMYEFAPAAGVKVGKIVNLQDDLALVMRAISVRVVAPIPGKAVVGIEIPNRRREPVLLRDLLEADEFRTASSKLSMALGKDILGKAVIIDLALIPHLLVAGATGSGKSVGLNSLICSLLFHATPADVKLIMIDPKMLEFSVYEGIPHLLIPVVTNPKKAAVALRRVVEEMGRRYQLLAARGVRSIAQYNQVIAEEQRMGRVETGQGDEVLEEPPMPAEKLPYLVVIIDELSDLMVVSSREVEDSLMRIAQMARAAGIHLIVATQRPSVDVLTGVIKANFPARISFQVTSKVDSRTILDTNGAEKLLGRGDMLFLAPGTSKPQRVHGAYVSEAEIGRLVEAWKATERPCYDETFLEAGGEQAEVEPDGYDEKYDEAVALVAKTGQASISMLQRRLRVGYNRAARMIEIMEQEGVVGPADGVKPRTVLVRNTYDDM